MAEYMPASVSDLARRIVGTEDQQNDHTPQLAYSSIEDGAIDEYDGNGVLSSQIGRQFDGTHAAVSLAGPPPPMPSLPVVTAGPMSLSVRWNGKFDGGALSPMDFSHVEVHVSTAGPDFETLPATLKTTLRGELGDEAVISPLTSVEHYVKFVARSLSGKPSVATGAVAAIPEAIASSTADGKITVEDYAPTLADGEGKPVNATWSQLDPTTGAQIAFWRWTGVEWVDMPLTETIIPAINVGTGVYGTLKGVTFGAEIFNGTLITGAVFQTDEAPGVGIKIDSATNTFTSYGPDGISVLIDGDTGNFSATGEMIARKGDEYVRLAPDISDPEVDAELRPGIEFGTASGHGNLPRIQTFGANSTTAPHGTLLVSGAETTLNTTGRADLLLEPGGDFNLMQSWGANSGVGAEKVGPTARLRGAGGHAGVNDTMAYLVAITDVTHPSATQISVDSSGNAFLQSGAGAEVQANADGSVAMRSPGGANVVVTDEYAWLNAPMAYTNGTIHVNAETWHTVGATGEPGYLNGWGPEGAGMQFRKTADGSVHIRGNATVSGGVNNGSIVFNLPAGYCPTANTGEFIVFQQSATPAKFGSLEVQDDGGVAFWIQGNSGGTYVSAAGVIFSTL